MKYHLSDKMSVKNIHCYHLSVSSLFYHSHYYFTRNILYYLYYFVHYFTGNISLISHSGVLSGWQCRHVRKLSVNNVSELVIIVWEWQCYVTFWRKFLERNVNGYGSGIMINSGRKHVRGVHKSVYMKSCETSLAYYVNVVACFTIAYLCVVCILPL